MLHVIAQWVVLAGLLYRGRRRSGVGRGRRTRRATTSAGASRRRSTTAWPRNSRTSAPRAAVAANGGNNDEQLAKLHQAADHALGEARRVISAYGHEGDRRLGGVIAELSRDIEQRYGCHVVLDLDDDIIVDSHTAHEVGRIASEALVNAARHRRAEADLGGLASRSSRSACS